MANFPHVRGGDRRTSPESPENKIKLSLRLPAELLALIKEQTEKSSWSMEGRVKHFVELELITHLKFLEPSFEASLREGEQPKIFKHELPNDWREESITVRFELPEQEYGDLLRIKQKYTENSAGSNTGEKESRNLFFARVIYDAVKKLEYLKSQAKWREGAS